MCPMNVVFFFCLLVTAVHSNNQYIGEKFDIGFVLDPSGSLRRDDFKIMLNFITGLVHKFNDRSKVQAGVITFSDQTKVEFSVDSYTDLAQLQRTISNFANRQRRTNAAKAPRLHQEQFKSNLKNSESPKVLIFFTDGQTDPAAIEEAKKLRQRGIKVYAIGVGVSSMYGIVKLKSIASDPDNGVFTVASYSALKDIAEKFHNQLCEEYIGEKFDIGFVLDPSGSLRRDDFKIMLNFITGLVHKFNDRSKVQAGVITFSDQTKVEFSVDSYTDLAQLQRTISNFANRQRRTNAAKAPRLHQEQFKSNLKNSESPKVLIFFTDGQTDPAAIEEAKKLRQRGIKVYAIGVGVSSMYGIVKLKSIASDPDNGVFTVASYSALKDIAEKFHNQLCEEYIGNKFDIMFVLDSFSSIREENFKMILNFTTGLMHKFNDRSKVRAGLITFSDQTKVEFSVDSYTDTAQLKRTISNFANRQRRTNAAKAPRLLKERVEPNLKNSKGPTIAIVIRDGQSADTVATKEEAKKLHQLGIKVYAIGVGVSSMYDIAKLKSIASDPDDGFILWSVIQHLQTSPKSYTISYVKTTT